jgi:hypothetical protein
MCSWRRWRKKGLQAAHVSQSLSPAMPMAALPVGGACKLRMCASVELEPCCAISIDDGSAMRVRQSLNLAARVQCQQHGTMLQIEEFASGACVKIAEH